MNVNGSLMSLAKYASLRRLQLVTAADFNEKLRGNGSPKILTVQKVCGLAKNEAEVRDSFGLVWKEPDNAENVLADLRRRNEDLYRFEEMLSGVEPAATLSGKHDGSDN